MANQGGRRSTRPSPAVYRRRRIVVGTAALIVVVALITVIVLAVNHFSKPATEASQNSPSNVGSSAGQTTSSPNASTAAPACDQSKVTIKASTDAASYTDGNNPVFALTVTNGGSQPCQVNVGTSQMEFLVQSGDDRIFSSKDCQDKAENLTKTIAAGASEKAIFPWQRNRSVPGCTAVSAKPGTGSNALYTLTVKLGDRTSAKAVFKLLS
ncbi:hypothetical protein FHU41_002333 [Psychromicrobium silvestre]|uniref:DUF4232 domain-containing protein n=1 Tax=Psychromicrobium silvestre TaxID=1645614 RepID=A0A7Y9LUY5_9MICC|nr:hypothetical protein [Psychromicrobium silvestre]NYE96083.1 hypothetical protein [Psychromicrobium silvestre]